MIQLLSNIYGIEVPEDTGNTIIRQNDSCDFTTISCYNRWTNRETTLLIPNKKYQLIQPKVVSEYSKSEIIELGTTPWTLENILSKHKLDSKRMVLLTKK